MNWQTILQHDSGSDEPLRQRIDALFLQQRNSWPALREGEAALGHLQKKTLVSNGQSVVVQVNPARRRSTLAKTDAKAVAARACFLCPENMPAEERGVAFEDLVVLPNPYPILPLHCTIAAREHGPQQLTGRLDAFLRLAEAVGPEMAVLYNGPRCGASAPDHLHFQAARADEIPMLAQLPTISSSRSVNAYSSFGRHALVFTRTNAAEVQADVERSMNALAQIESASDEPMLNLLAYFHAGRWTAVLFPRAVHRPACYFAAGPDQLSVSPAILEMCGILVTTEPDHFARLDAVTANAIYAEVSITPAQFSSLTAAVSALRCSGQ